MARLSDGNPSWKGDGLREKYSDWESRERPPKPAKKNKKKWCKGKKGVEHDYQPYEKRFGQRSKWAIKKCVRCQKEDWEGFTRIPDGL